MSTSTQSTLSDEKQLAASPSLHLAPALLHSAYPLTRAVLIQPLLGTKGTEIKQDRLDPSTRGETFPVIRDQVQMP